MRLLLRGGIILIAKPFSFMTVLDDHLRPPRPFNNYFAKRAFIVACITLAFGTSFLFGVETDYNGIIFYGSLFFGTVLCIISLSKNEHWRFYKIAGLILYFFFFALLGMLWFWGFY